MTNVNEEKKELYYETHIGERKQIATVIINLDYGHGDCADVNVCEECAKLIKKNSQKQGYICKRKESK